MKYLKKYNESLNESEIHEICKKYDIENYTINDDGSIDVDDDVSLYKIGLTKLPLRFGRVTGNFDCSYNQLTSLDGAPKSVGNFDCSYNELTSLEGGPESIGGLFWCNNNQLTSLEGTPKKVGDNFYCYDNNIMSLDGLEFKSFSKIIDLKDNPIYPIVRDWINRRDRDELIEYFVDMGVIQGNKLIKERLFAFYDEVDILGLNDLKDYKVV